MKQDLLFHSKLKTQNPEHKEFIYCLGMTFENDEARREYFLTKLREGLEELHEKLGGVPFTTVEDAVEKMKSIKKWPMGDEKRLRELAERMWAEHRQERDKDLLQLWKDQVGFPHGEIEDILRLSDPPYYTACPNPFIVDFICHLQEQKSVVQGSEFKVQGSEFRIRDSSNQEPTTQNQEPYQREPFAADVSEGKNDPIYNAHSYHTKVPHKAIMRYILHYTEPGDLVFDGFCGTGMTGVAAQLCGDRKAVESLGYRVDDKGIIYQQETDENGKTVWKPFSRLGARYAILNDLSPAATFIAYNYNTPVDVEEFEREAKRILKEVEEECGWMYATLAREVQGSGFRVQGLKDEEVEQLAKDLMRCKSPEECRNFINQLKTQNPELKTHNPELKTPTVTLGKINYTVWSDVFVCPECTNEIIFWDVAVDKAAGKVHKEFPCPHCDAVLTKQRMERAWVTKYDKAIGKTIRQAKQVPVLINYSVEKKRFEKTPDAFDLALIEKIEQMDIPYWFPTDRMPEGEESRRNDDIGLTHVHHFYTKRNLWVLGAIRKHCKIPQILLMFNSQLINISRLNRYRPGVSFPYNPLSGTLYVGSQISEANIFNAYTNKISRMVKAYSEVVGRSFIFTNSTDIVDMKDNSIDYIFTDPPFGGNLMYSELNFLWEAWLKVYTNNKSEAIENKVQGKGLFEYKELMTLCFKEYFRILKPGRWMTVEFHNSKNIIWNAIQEALQHAGFVVADVRTLDKGLGTFKQVTSGGAVKQDLIISAYKPNGGLEERFKLSAGTEEGVWDFIRTHLRQLPTVVVRGSGFGVSGSKSNQEPGTLNSKLEIVAERQNYLLYDRMVAFHVQRGVTVPMSAAEFYAGLAQRFPERDGMYFLPEQVAEYDKRRLKTKEVLQLEIWIKDESSAIQWLKQQLTKKPQTFQELHPQFLKEISGWQKHEKPLELLELLEQNFLRYDGKGPIPQQIVSWMHQSAELRKTIEEELATGRATEENGQLRTQNQKLITRAKDRWYVPDPNKASDLEKLREKALLREFEEYKQSKQKRLKVFRLEAVRAGFKKAWQERDYATIISVARKIPESVLQEDPKLLMWYDQAVTRMGGE
jgi:DNA modification methylase